MKAVERKEWQKLLENLKEEDEISRWLETARRRGLRKSLIEKAEKKLELARKRA